jgi:hypothetical protein
MDSVIGAINTLSVSMRGRVVTNRGFWRLPINDAEMLSSIVARPGFNWLELARTQEPREPSSVHGRIQL